MEKNLKIYNQEDYKTGMKTFKTDTLSNIDYYHKKQKEMGFTVKIVFQTKGKKLYISVHNNSEITREEHVRIFENISRTCVYNDISEVFAHIQDDAEGAGLGIMILILMLKKIGLNEDAIEMDFKNRETIIRIVIPFSDIIIDAIHLLTEAIVQEIHSFPFSPGIIHHLQKLISDPHPDVNKIVSCIQTDPGLTAEIFKIANSHVYKKTKKIEKIDEAITLIGIGALRNMFNYHGTHKILGENYITMKKMRIHALKVATYAYIIAYNGGKRGDILDDVFIGGINHDLGKIAFSSLHPPVVDKIVKFCIEKGISAHIVEDIIAGLNHTETGAALAEKWDLPDQIIAAIRAHHEPSTCPDQYKDVVYPIYLANFICNYEDKLVVFDQIDPIAKRYFKLTSDMQFTELITSLKKNFDGEG